VAADRIATNRPIAITKGYSRYFIVVSIRLAARVGRGSGPARLVFLRSP
jgi:hypothetical protein